MERPILFSAPMVRAILAGTKTQTRRTVKITHRTPGLAACLLPVDPAWVRPKVAAELCPYGAPGDRLWVRETFGTRIVNDWPNPVGPIIYRADGNWEHNPGRWHPSIHMARRWSRITLEITSIRVERLQEISEADCRAEGLGDSVDRAHHWYRVLWDQINGPGSWDASPWVWVIEFKRVTEQ